MMCGQTEQRRDQCWRVCGNEWNDRHARMNVGKPVGNNEKYAESDVCYFELNALSVKSAHGGFFELNTL